MEYYARCLTPEKQYELRKQIIRLLRKGASPDETAAMLELSRSYVYKVKRAYDIYGIGGIKPCKRGRRYGQKTVLSPKRERAIQRALVYSPPEQPLFPDRLWTKENVRILIKSLYKIKMPPSTLGDYLAKWGLSAQSPLRADCQRDVLQVADWSGYTFPTIRQCAQQERAAIFYIHTGVVWIPGKAAGSKKVKVHKLSAVSSQGKQYFGLYEGAISANSLLNFFRCLINDVGQKVFIFMDFPGVPSRPYSSKTVRRWLLRDSRFVRFFFLRGTPCGKGVFIA